MRVVCMGCRGLEVGVGCIGTEADTHSEQRSAMGGGLGPFGWVMRVPVFVENGHRPRAVGVWSPARPAAASQA